MRREADGNGGVRDRWAVDIAAATVMLCGADTITGQTLVVDGGMPGAMNFG